MNTLVLAVLVVLTIIAAVWIGRQKQKPDLPCGGCSGGLPVCDPVTGLCVACTSADTSRCPHGSPYCTVDNLCKMCVGDATGCSAGTFCLHGDRCVVCRNGGDCGGRICLPDNSGCVDCLSDGNCLDTTRPRYDPTKPYCDAASNKCVACRATPVDTCGSDSPTAPHCKNGTCVRCAVDADCGPGAFCVAGADGAPTCVSCVTGDPKRQCANGQYCVGDPAMCVQCVAGDAAHACPAGHTCVGGQCVQSCAKSADCGAAGSTPNCIGGLCVACATDSECATAFPGLLPFCGNGLCVQCLVNAAGSQEGCPNPSAPLCVESICQQCFRDTDCAGNPVGPFCQKTETTDGTQYKCVACTSDEYCAQHSSATPYCSPDGHACVACDADHPCPSGKVCGRNGRCVDCDADHPCASGGICSDLSGGQCVQCRTEADCAGRAGTHCDTATGNCVTCRSNTDCSGVVPVCLPDGSACVQCVSNANCPTVPNVHCSTVPGTAHTCIQCDADADCPDPNNKYCFGHACTSCAGGCSGTTPYCIAGACIQCRGDGDCPAGGFCNNGACTVCPTSPSTLTTGTSVFITNQAAGPAQWLCPIISFDASCGTWYLTKNTGDTPIPPFTKLTWNGAKTFQVQIVNGLVYLGSYWVASMNGDPPEPSNATYFVRDPQSWDGLSMAGGDPKTPYVPQNDPNAGWVYEDGLIIDPARTVVLTTYTLDPHECNFVSNGTLGVKLAPKTEASCLNQANSWSFAIAPAVTGFRSRREGFRGISHSVLAELGGFGAVRAASRGPPSDGSILDEFRAHRRQSRWFRG